MKKIYTLLITAVFMTSLANAQDKKACLEFDGVDDKVVIPHQAELNIGRSAFTIEAWISGSGFMVSNNVLAPMVLSKKGAGSSSMDGLLFGLTDQGKMAIQLEGNSFSPGFGPGPGVSAKDLRDGIGHHIAWTREVYPGQEDTVNAYQDAAYVKKSRKRAGNVDIDNTEDVWIGASEFNTAANTYQFQGQIKEIRIWNYAKTEPQIFADKNKHLKGNEAGLLFYWRLNENSGTLVNDCGPDGADGTIDGATWANFIYDNLDNIPTPNNCVGGTPPPPTGIDDANKGINLVLYPNPVADELRLLTDQELDIDRVIIYDMNGQEVLSKNWNGKDALNVNNLEMGTYFIQVSNQGRPIYKTIVVKR